MLTRKIVRFSAVALIGFACVMASEARAQLVSALTAPTVCDFNEGTIRIEAGLGQPTFPSDVSCPGEGATGICSKYNYRFSSTGGNIVKSFLSVSADLDIFAASSGEGTPATIEDPSCGTVPANIRPGNRICEQRTVRFNSTGSTIDANVIVKRSVPRVSTAGARKGGGCFGEGEECWNPPAARVCLIQGPGLPSTTTALIPLSSKATILVANGHCSIDVTYDGVGGFLSAMATPGFVPMCSVESLVTPPMIDGQELKIPAGGGVTAGPASCFYYLIQGRNVRSCTP